MTGRVPLTGIGRPMGIPGLLPTLSSPRPGRRCPAATRESADQTGTPGFGPARVDPTPRATTTKTMSDQFDSGTDRGYGSRRADAGSDSHYEDGRRGPDRYGRRTTHAPPIATDTEAGTSGGPAEACS